MDLLASRLRDSKHSKHGKHTPLGTKEELRSIRLEDYYTVLLSPGGESLLHLCARYGHYDEMLILLRDVGVDPNIYNANRQSPLMYACAANQNMTMQLLLEYGADPCLRCGRTNRTARQITTDGNMQLILAQHEQDRVPLDSACRCRPGCSLMQCFHYRYYLAWAACLTWYVMMFINRQRVDEEADIRVNPKGFLADAISLKESQGLGAVVRKCAEFRDRWLSAMKKESNLTSKKKKTSEPSVHYCAICGCCALKQCSRCHDFYVCGVDCQKKSHPVHRLDCNNSSGTSISTNTTTTRTTPSFSAVPLSPTFSPSPPTPTSSLSLPTSTAASATPTRLTGRNAHTITFGELSYQEGRVWLPLNVSIAQAQKLKTKTEFNFTQPNPNHPNTTSPCLLEKTENRTSSTATFLVYVPQPGSVSFVQKVLDFLCDHQLCDNDVRQQLVEHAQKRACLL